MFSNAYIIAIAASLGVATIVIIYRIGEIVFEKIQENKNKEKNFNMTEILQNYRKSLLKREIYEEIPNIDRFLKILKEGKKLPREFYKNYEVKCNTFFVMEYNEHEETEVGIRKIVPYLEKKVKEQKKNTKKNK